MSTFSGLAAGIVGLSVMQLVLTNAGNAGALVALPAKILDRWLDPFTPLIPDITNTGSNPGAAYTGGAAATPA